MQQVRDFIDRYKKTILIILAVLLVIFIIIFSLPRKKLEEPALNESIRGAEIVEQKAPVEKELTEEDISRANIIAVAKSFGEIYGSYSNQSNFTNIETLLSLLAPIYKGQMTLYLKNARDNFEFNEEYQGVSTVVLSPRIDEFEEQAGTAVVLLKTQRKESVGSQANYVIKYQDLTVSLQKIGTSWLVSGAKWGE